MTDEQLTVIGAVESGSDDERASQGGSVDDNDSLVEEEPARIVGGRPRTHKPTLVEARQPFIISRTVGGSRPVDGLQFVSLLPDLIRAVFERLPSAQDFLALRQTCVTFYQVSSTRACVCGVAVC